MTDKSKGLAFAVGYLVLLTAGLAWSAHTFQKVVDRCHSKGGQMIRGDVCIRRSEVIVP